MPKPDKDYRKRKTTGPHDKTDAIIHHKTEFNSTLKGHTPESSEIYPWMQGGFNIHKSINLLHHINKMMDKNYINISINPERIWQSLIASYDKNKRNLEGNYL